MRLVIQDNVILTQKLSTLEEALSQHKSNSSNIQEENQLALKLSTKRLHEREQELRTATKTLQAKSQETQTYLKDKQLLHQQLVSLTKDYELYKSKFNASIGSNVQQLNAIRESVYQLSSSVKVQFGEFKKFLSIITQELLR
jgi:chromosome segregation ATPase